MHTDHAAGALLGVQRFSLPNLLAIEPGILEDEHDHEHDDSIASFAMESRLPIGPDGLEGPQHVYCLAFDAADIWGAAKSEPNTVICADLFDAYLKAPH